MGEQKQTAKSTIAKKETAKTMKAYILSLI
jgi:hypothetical protein